MDKRYEEALERAKAKAYDEALEWMRDLYPTMEGSVKEDAEHYFPELKESEDERIRKALLRCCDDWEKGQFGCMAAEDVHAIRAYLEKQKGNVEKEYVFRPMAGTEITIAAEQSIRMAKRGEHLVLAFNGLYIPVNKHDNAKSLVDKYYSYLKNQKERPSTVGDIAAAYQMGLAAGRKEQKPLSTEETELNSIAFLEQMGYTCIPPKEQKPAEWSEDDDNHRKDAILAIQEYRSECIKKYGKDPAWADCVDWLKSINPQPKQEWSDDDEQYLLVCKNALSKYQRSDQWDAAIIFTWLENRLKSPRPQSHWKPSEEQISALEYFIRSWGESGTMSPQNPTLCAAKSLLNDLKKL